MCMNVCGVQGNTIPAALHNSSPYALSSLFSHSLLPYCVLDTSNLLFKLRFVLYLPQAMLLMLLLLVIVTTSTGR